MELNSVLSKLAAHSVEEEKSRGKWSPKDDISHLDLNEKSAWAGLLASIASSEAMEKVLLDPLIAGFNHDPAVARWVKVHSRDEIRHLGIINRYLENTFKFKRRGRTLTDVIIYDSILPVVASRGEKNPLTILAILYFYEAFSVAFYRSFKDRAAARDLPSLVKIFKFVEKDELRHVTALEGLIDRRLTSHGRPGAADLIAISSLLTLVLADINTSPWAIYNRRVRHNVLTVGVSPEAMNRQAFATARETWNRIRGSR